MSDLLKKVGFYGSVLVVSVVFLSPGGAMAKSIAWESSPFSMDVVCGAQYAYAASFEVVDIYSSSWGPSDNGKTLEGPGKLD